MNISMAQPQNSEIFDLYYNDQIIVNGTPCIKIELTTTVTGNVSFMYKFYSDASFTQFTSDSNVISIVNGYNILQIDNPPQLYAIGRLILLPESSARIFSLKINNLEHITSDNIFISHSTNTSKFFDLYYKNRIIVNSTPCIKLEITTKVTGNVSFLYQFYSDTSFTQYTSDSNVISIVNGYNILQIDNPPQLYAIGRLTLLPESTLSISSLKINNVEHITSGNLFISNLSYKTSSYLFTSTTTNLADKLLTQRSLTDGILGILQLGSVLTTTNFSGTTYGVTLSTSDNSSSLATTAFVKAQNYAANASLAYYAQMAVAQTWSAVQTFNGILSSTYNALTPTSTLSVGSNLTTGILNLGISTSFTTLAGTSNTIQNPTILNPVTIGYSTTTDGQPLRGTFNRVGGLGNTVNSTFTSNSTAQIRAVINGLPNGRYLLFAYVFLPSIAPVQKVEQRFAYSSSAMTNGQTTGYTVLTDGIGEMFGYKPFSSAEGALYGRNVCHVFDVIDGRNNVGVLVLTGLSSINTFATLNMMRIS